MKNKKQLDKRLIISHVQKPTAEDDYSAIIGYTLESSDIFISKRGYADKHTSNCEDANQILDDAERDAIKNLYEAKDELKKTHGSDQVDELYRTMIFSV